MEFYIESPVLARARITDETGRELVCQVSPHPRGRKISFYDDLKPHEEKIYTYTALPAEQEQINSRKCYIGAERVRDIANDYDPVSFRLPYEFENRWFCLKYEIGRGITSLFDKQRGVELTGRTEIPLFVPVYECTAIDGGEAAARGNVYEQRRLIGRNIRGAHAKVYAGELMSVSAVERGSVFTLLRLCFRLPGTIQADLLIRLYEEVPRIDLAFQIGKTLSKDIESVFLPIGLNLPSSELYIRKGAEAFRPGIDQIPGTCMEYYMTDDGIAYVSPGGSLLLSTPDAPLIYMGELKAHAIRLCDGKKENNERPVCSWIMNNTWETNFKMDLSGFGEFRCSLQSSDASDPEQAMDELRESQLDPFVAVIE